MLKSPVDLERLLLLSATTIYLVVFNRTLPHGDALRVVRQIEQGQLAWNPNHLLFDPIGYGLFRAMELASLGLSPLGTFELLSGVATLTTVWLLHELFRRVGADRAYVRLVATVGVFASAPFLSLALSQFYFMIQMPFLVGALLLSCRLFLDEPDGRRGQLLLVSIGALLGVATAILFSNVLLVLFGGLALGLDRPSLWRWNARSALRVWYGAALVGVPVFLAGYFLAQTSAGPLTWLVSYQGDPDSHLNQFFGLRWSASGVAQASGMVAFNLLVGALVENAGLGTVLSVLVLGKDFEFIPQWERIALGLAAVPLTLVFTAAALWMLSSRIKADPALRWLGAWMVSLLAFAFFWNDSNEHFWVQLVPVIWILGLSTTGLLREVPPFGSGSQRRPDGGRPWLLDGSVGVLVILLLVVNTLNVAVPVSRTELESKRARHEALLRDGDLEIVPGWDQQKWMGLGESAPGVRVVSLMNLAIASMGAQEGQESLSRLVDNQLQTGGRVIVARLYDLDHDLMPWYALQRAGWSRAEVKKAFSRFCNTPLAEIDGIVFRELHYCHVQPRPED